MHSKRLLECRCWCAVSLGSDCALLPHSHGTSTDAVFRYLASGADDSSVWLDVKRIEGREVVCEAKNATELSGAGGSWPFDCCFLLFAPRMTLQGRSHTALHTLRQCLHPSSLPLQPCPTAMHCHDWHVSRLADWVRTSKNSTACRAADGAALGA